MQREDSHVLLQLQVSPPLPLLVLQMFSLQLLELLLLEHLLFGLLYRAPAARVCLRLRRSGTCRLCLHSYLHVVSAAYAVAYVETGAAAASVKHACAVGAQIRCELRHAALSVLLQKHPCCP